MKVRNVVVLASGSGTTAQAVIDAIQDGKLDMHINLIVSNNQKAYALQRAEKAHIDTYVLSAKTDEERDQELYELLQDYDVDVILLLGYLKKIGPKVLSKYLVINTHPALLPKYGGMYGMNVHRAVVENKEKESGVTLHFANEEYDKGQIIWQTSVPVFPEDTADDVSERVQAVEKTQLVYLLKAMSQGKII